MARGEFAPAVDGPVIELPKDADFLLLYPTLWDLEDQFWREPGLSVGGRRHGEWTVWYHTHRGAVKACEGRFFDDERHGEWRRWHESGKLWWMGRYEGGRKEGEWNISHPTGWLWAHVPMQADLPHGEYTRGHDVPMQADLPHGEYTRGHDDGVPAAKGHYSHGKKVGKWAYWDEDGRRLQKDPWRLELPQLYADGSELQLLAHVEHGPQGERYGALKHLILLEGRTEHDITRELWLREKQWERAQAEREKSGKPFTAPTLGPLLLLALYDMKPDRYLKELRRLHAYRFGAFHTSDRFKAGGAWRSMPWTGGEFLWVGESGYRLMARGELPSGDALKETLRMLSRLVDSPWLANRRRAAEVFAKFEGAPAFDPEAVPGTTKENAGDIVVEWLRANVKHCKWDGKAQVYRCNPASP
jgi:hypothetical protein